MDARALLVLCFAFVVHGQDGPIVSTKYGDVQGQTQYTDGNIVDSNI